MTDRIKDGGPPPRREKGIRDASLAAGGGGMRTVIKYCKRCGGTGVLARCNPSINYVTCTRCSGRKGSLSHD